MAEMKDAQKYWSPSGGRIGAYLSGLSGEQSRRVPGATGNRISRNPTERRAPSPTGYFEPLTSLPRMKSSAAVRGSPFRLHRRSGLIVKLETSRRSDSFVHLQFMLPLNLRKSSSPFEFFPNGNG